MRQLDQYKIKLYYELAKQPTLSDEEVGLMAVLINDPALQFLFESATIDLPEPTMSEAETRAKVMADSIFDTDTSIPIEVNDDMVLESKPYTALDELEKFLGGVHARKAELRKNNLYQG
jgi:hypothetical protein